MPLSTPGMPSTSHSAQVPASGLAKVTKSSFAQAKISAPSGGTQAAISAPSGGTQAAISAPSGGTQAAEKTKSWVSIANIIQLVVNIKQFTYSNILGLSRQNYPCKTRCVCKGVQSHGNSSSGIPTQN